MKEKTYQFYMDEVRITVVKKRIKNMYLRIKKEDGSVVISTPLQMSDERIQCFAHDRIEWIKKYQSKYADAKKQRKSQPKLSGAELNLKKESLKKEVEVLVKKWEPVIGVSVSGITVRQMKTRWGSCNVQNHKITINLALQKKPRECLEYVVVHEMTHLLEAAHNVVFWGHMSHFYPEWKRIRAYLNDETVE